MMHEVNIDSLTYADTLCVVGADAAMTGQAPHKGSMGRVCQKMCHINSV